MFLKTYVRQQNLGAVHTHTHTHTGSNLINVKKVVNSYFNCDGKIDFYLKSKGAY